MRAAQEAQGETFALPADSEQVFPQAITPDDFQALPVIASDMQALAQYLPNLDKRGRSAIHARFQYLHGSGVGIEQVVHFVPFDLEGYQNGNDIISIADAGNVCRQGVFTIIKPLAPPRRCRHRLPAINLKALLQE